MMINPIEIVGRLFIQILHQFARRDYGLAEVAGESNEIWSRMCSN